MSCFILEENRIASLAAELMQRYSSPLQEWRDRQSLAFAMLQMNIDAFVARYEGRYTDELPKPEDVDMDKQPLDTFSPVQFFKSLQCYLYQCGEGDVPEKPLFKALEKIRNSLARRISSKTEEYEAAQWG